ncbi:uncharacterized protein LOC125024603 [Penaeus chinensis]|uniref:uncharacterized protein LOC125024603 n=1 Tax=Penaeus chinensis TaxID=139456 RepID=UPI001FB70D01|nr:uncharacterized protein LOC125024603 [Penaeus chinensis]
MLTAWVASLVKAKCLGNASGIFFPDCEVHCVRFGGGGCALCQRELCEASKAPWWWGSEESERKCRGADRTLIRREMRVLRITTRMQKLLQFCCQSCGAEERGKSRATLPSRHLLISGGSPAGRL